MIANIFSPDLLIVIVVVGGVLFGGKRIPSLARNLGSAKTEFEKGLREANATPESNDSEEKPQQ